MRSLALALLLLALWPLAGLAQYAAVEWRQLTRTEVALFLDGVQAGNLRLTDGLYFPVIGQNTWGEPCEPPAEVPVQYRPKPSWRESGVAVAKTTTQVTVGGDPKAVEKVTRQAEAKPVKVPAYQSMASVTIVSADASRRNAIAQDFQSNPALAAWKAERVKAMDPNDPLLAPFKLAEDAEFQRTGLVVIYQPAPDATGHAPDTRLYEYTSAEEAAGMLRDIAADYDPNDSAYTGWTRTHVGLGVGLGVASVFSVIFGGLLSWARSKPSLPLS